MANYSLILGEKLKTIMHHMSDNRNSFVKKPGKDFSRNRKFSFFGVLYFLTRLQGQCLDKELLHFYKYSQKVPTNSAMIQKRGKMLCTSMCFII